MKRSERRISTIRVVQLIDQQSLSAAGQGAALPMAAHRSERRFLLRKQVYDSPQKDPGSWGKRLVFFGQNLCKPFPRQQEIKWPFVDINRVRIGQKTRFERRRRRGF